MHYKTYSADDFIQDEFFQSWVYSPTQEKNDYWKSFLLHYPAQVEKVEEARQFLLAMKVDRSVPESLIQRIKSDLNSAVDRLDSSRIVDKQAHRAGSSPAKPAFVKILFPIAASFLLLAFFTGYFLIQNKAVLHALTLEEKNTSKGKQRHIILEDGTHVWLNAKSQIRYPSTFVTGDVREVFLKGEAFFEVAENKEKPFIVHASDLSIKVLGTAFNVKSYDADSIVETTLVSGRVTIASTADHIPQALTLLPNQQALFMKESKRMALDSAVNTEDFIGWKNGLIVFDNKPFSYIKDILERWYNVTIRIEDEKSLSCTFSGKFKDKSLEEVLEIFKSTESIEYSIEGDQVFIDGTLCEYQNRN